jgi:AraC-like DNA-binding protein
MGERFATDFAVADVARQLGCSYSRLSAEFKRRTGKTLHQYRIQLRLRRAFVELLAGRDGLADLASSLGFSTHSHFTSSFRAAFGLPPSDLGRRIDERSFRQALAALQGPMRSSS